MRLLDGKAAADALILRLEEEVRLLPRRPRLTVLQVGHEPGGLSYLRAARSRCERLGIDLELRALPDDCTTGEALSAVDAINADPAADGCLILRPMPWQVDEHRVCQRLDARKDVDGITNASLGKVLTGAGEGFTPCTAEACLRLLDACGIELRGARVTVVGRSLVVGRPLALLLTARDATVTLCHSRTRELPSICREAELLVSAVGKVSMIGPDYVNPDQVILDVGTSLDARGRLRGDVDFDSVAPLVRAISPVPGGVGALTTAVLAAHLVEASRRAQLGC